MSDASQEPADSLESSIDPQSVEGLFIAALGKSTPKERSAFLDEVCGDDSERRMRIEALLRAYDDAGSFMEKPVAGLPNMDDPLSFDFLKPSDDPSLLGTLGPYEIYEVIGRGGMGIVFRARDPKLNRVVAVKVLAPELAANPNARRRFVREAQAGASISHPHVVTIHAVDDAAKLPYLVMECIVGQSLQQKLDKVGSLRLTEVLRISKQIAEGLTAAHKQGLIHRDIKPANILLENGVERVKITDFGLARAVDDVSVTRTGEVAGSPQFMSPEQAKGERVDHRSDLFSLGCVIYAMCTGRSPFRATSIAAAIRRVCDDTPRPIIEINPEVPQWLIEVVDNLLNKDADARFQSAQEVENVLENQLLGIQGTAPAPQSPTRPQRQPVPVEQSERLETEPSTQPLLEQLHSALLRLAFLGPVLTLIAIAVLAIEPKLIPSEYTELVLKLLIPGLWIAGILAWTGSAFHRVKWGNEAYLKGILASFAATISPPVWLVGIPTGFAALWTLNQRSVSNAYQQRGEVPPFTILKPKSLLDLGTFIGAVLSSLIFLELGRDSPFTSVDAIEAAVPMLILMAATLPFRGELFRGRLLRDVGICLLAIILASAGYGIARNPEISRIGPAEWLVIISVLFFTFGIPLIVVWYLVIRPRLQAGEQVAVLGSSTVPGTATANESGVQPVEVPRESSFARFAKRLVYGVVAVCVLALVSYQLPSFFHKATRTTGQLVIHHYGEAKPLRVTLDGKEIQPYAQSQSYTSFSGLEAGPRQLEIRMRFPSGHEPTRTQRIEITPGGQTSVSIGNEQVPAIVVNDPPPPAANGRMLLQVEDQGVSLVLDGPEHIVFRAPIQLGQGEHTLPSGVYTAVIHDNQFGWVIQSQSLAGNGPNDEASSMMMGSSGGGFGFESGYGEDMYGGGGYSGSQNVAVYSFPDITIQPGEFTNTTIKRDWKALAAAHGEFKDGIFYQFLWNGKEYSLTANQARIVDQLFQAFAKGTYAVLEETLLKELKVEKTETIASIFNDGKHPAWNHVLKPTLNTCIQLRWSEVNESFPIAEGNEKITLESIPNRLEHSMLTGDQVQIYLYSYQQVDDSPESGMTTTLIGYGYVSKITMPADMSSTDVQLIVSKKQAQLIRLAKTKGSVGIVTKPKDGKLPVLDIDAATAIVTALPDAKSTINSSIGMSVDVAGPKEKGHSGAVIVKILDQNLSPMASLDENGLFKSLKNGTQTLAVGTYFPKVIDEEFGWSMKNAKSWQSPWLDYGTFEVKQGEFTDLTIKRDWSKLAAQKPAEVNGFYPFRWLGTEFVLSKPQSKIVDQLLKSFAAKKVLVKPAELVESHQALDIVKSIFNNGNHPAWGNLIEVVDGEFVRLKWKGWPMRYGWPPGLQPLTVGIDDVTQINGLIGFGQSLDVLVQLPGEEHFRELVSNSKIMALAENQAGESRVEILLTPEQIIAVQVARKHAKLRFLWKDIENNAPDPQLNEQANTAMQQLYEQEAAEARGQMEASRNERSSPRTLLHGERLKSLDQQVEQTKEGIEPITDIPTPAVPDPVPTPQPLLKME